MAILLSWTESFQKYTAVNLDDESSNGGKIKSKNKSAKFGNVHHWILNQTN